MFFEKLHRSDTNLRPVLSGSRQVLDAYVMLSCSIAFLSCQGALPPDPPTFFGNLILKFLKKSTGDINEAADSTINQISQNAARWWSSFACSLLVALFRDVPEISNTGRVRGGIGMGSIF